MLEIKIENVVRDYTSCNFCNRGELNDSGKGLKYPYESVISFTREYGGGIKVSICKSCLDELISKTKNINI